VTYELDHDLTAWAEGNLARADLLTLHGEEARALVRLHERLLGAAETATPDPVAGWAVLQRGMDAKVVPIRTGRRPRVRRALLTVAAALVIGGGAFAAIRGMAVDHPGVLAPAAGASASQDDTRERTPGEGDATSGTGERPGGGGASTSAPTGGTEGGTGGSTSGGTSTSGPADGTSSDGTSSDGDSGATSGGGTNEDPDGQHPGHGNGGEDHGNDGPHGRGGARSSTG
jgi:hypothetical protein